MRFIMIGLPTVLVGMMIISMMSCQKGGMGYSNITNVSGEQKISRDKSTPVQGLIGHWIEEEKYPHIKRHLFVSTDKIVYVEYFELSYKIQNTDLSKNTVAVTSGTKSGGHEKIFTLSEDMMTLTESSQLFNTPLNRKFKYVDSKIQP